MLSPFTNGLPFVCSPTNGQTSSLRPHGEPTENVPRKIVRDIGVVFRFLFIEGQQSHPGEHGGSLWNLGGSPLAPRGGSPLTPRRGSPLTPRGVTLDLCSLISKAKKAHPRAMEAHPGVDGNCGNRRTSVCLPQTQNGTTCSWQTEKGKIVAPTGIL